MRIRSFASSLALAVGLVVLVPAGADSRARDLRVAEYAVSESCGAPVREYCTQQFTQTVTTAGAVTFSLVRQPSSSICIGIDLFVDGVGRGSNSLGFPAFKVTPGPHTLVLRFYRLSDICGHVASWSGMLRVTTSVPRISGLQLTLRDRIAATESAIRSDVQRVASRKVALERRLEAAQDRGFAAVRKRQEVEAQAFEVWKQHGRARSSLARLNRSLPGLPGDGEGLRQALRQVGQRIAQLETSVVLAARDGRDDAVPRRNLLRARADRAELDEGLSARLPAATRDLRRRWQAAVDDADGRTHGLLVARAEADHAQVTAEAEVHRLLEEREGLDARATELARRLGVLDVDVREVRATVDGTVVFRAEGTRREFELIRELNTRLDATTRAFESYSALREQYRTEFYAALRETIAAESQLLSTIWNVFYAKAAVESAFNIWDVGSGFARGGLIGASTVATQKLIESGIAYAASSGGPDPIEVEVRRAYRDALSDSMGAEDLGSTAAQRVVKETVGKAGRDTLNRYLATKLFGPLGAPLPAAGSASFFRPLPTPARIREWLAAPKQFGATKQGIEGLRRGLQANRGVAGNMLTGFLKDVGKKMALAAIDDRERQAWRTLFEKEVIVRSLYPLYRVVTGFYWDIHDAHHALLHAKAALLEQNVDWRSGYRVLESQPFATDAQVELTVRVVAAGPMQPAPALEVGGKRLEVVATRAAAGGGILVYRLSAAELESGTDGLVSLDVR